ncbi:phytanoyl-CoA dioxygenase family protein [Blastopirellula marina]|nr:phytanoyl-CoA dioxygenase family protein [Blastopirellula marina]
MSNVIQVHRDPYASRMGEIWEAAPRIDPVVWPGRSGTLPDSEISSFADNGYLSFPQLLSSSEAAQCLAEAEEMRWSADQDRPEVITEPQRNEVRTIFRVHRDNERFRSICLDRRILSKVEQILGSDVYIHQSRINYKPAFHGKEFFWHSDFETWHVEDGMPRTRAISVSISLTDNHEFNGPLMLIQGSHQYYIRCIGETPENHYETSLKKQEFGVPSRQAIEFLTNQGSIKAPKGGPGSALMFDCNTMHGSAGNLSPTPRTNLFVVYNSVENRLVEPFGGYAPRPEFLAEREDCSLEQP